MKRLFLTLALTAQCATPVFATDHHVTIHGAAFLPATLVVERGDTVVFANADTQAHSATAIPRGFDTVRPQGGAFDTGLVEPGTSAAITVTRSGTVGFFSLTQPLIAGTMVSR